MALNASKVRVGVSGEVSVGPTATTAPTDATTALPSGFVGLGYVSDDGLTESPERDTDDITAWQNAAIVRTVTTSAKVSYQFTLIENTKATVEAGYGVSVTQTAAHGTYTIDPAATGGVKSWVFDVIDGSNLKRIYVAQGEVTERGETVYQNGEPVGLELTVSAYSNPVVFDTSLKTP